MKPFPSVTSTLYPFAKLNCRQSLNVWKQNSSKLNLPISPHSFRLSRVTEDCLTHILITFRYSESSLSSPPSVHSLRTCTLYGSQYSNRLRRKTGNQVSILPTSCVNSSTKACYLTDRPFNPFNTPIKDTIILSTSSIWFTSDHTSRKSETILIRLCTGHTGALFSFTLSTVITIQTNPSPSTICSHVPHGLLSAACTKSLITVPQFISFFQSTEFLNRMHPLFRQADDLFMCLCLYRGWIETVATHLRKSSQCASLSKS